MASFFHHRLLPLIGLLVVLVAGLLLYLPGTNGPFIFDDFHNFVHNRFVYMTELDLDSALDAAFSSGAHFPTRGMSRLSFALNHYYSGGAFDPRSFKFTNIVIHLLNAVLVFALAHALFLQHQLRHHQSVSRERVMWMALLSAGVWLLHPLQLTSVLYAVQRMTSMSALFVLLGLLVYVHGRTRVQRGEMQGFVSMALGIGAGSVLGVLNKENAALLPFLAFVVHLAFFPVAALESRMRRWLLTFHLLFVGSALVIVIGATVWSWSEIVAAFDFGREFSMSERLLTQPRVLFLYISLFLFPSLRRMSLHHDELVVSTGLLSPSLTIVALVVLVALVAFAAYRLRSGAIWAFAVVFFVVAHSMESSFLSLEMVHEHRNYLPSFALAMLFAYALTQFARRTTRPVLLPAVVGLVVILGISVVTWARVGIWSNESWLIRYMVEQHPNSYRALSLSARALVIEGGSASDIFAGYGRIADANPTAIFPLMRMRRLVNAMQYQLQADLMPAAGLPDGVAQTDEWNVRLLYRDLPYLNRVGAALNREISRRLPLAPLHNETLAELRQVRRCIEAQLDLCIGLDDDFQEWTRVALAESKMSAEARVRVLDELASQQERLGDFDAAHASLREADKLTSSTLFQLRRVVLFTDQKKFDEADRLLQQIEGIEGRTRVNRREAQRARRYLELARKGAQTAQQEPVAQVNIDR